MNIHDESYSLDVTDKINISGFDIFVYYNKDSGQYYAELLNTKDIVQALSDDAAAAWTKIGGDLNWSILLDQYAGKFRAGSSQIFLKQVTGNEIVGTLALNPLDSTKLVINFDQDTYNTNTLIEGAVTRGNIDAIINPETYNPGTPVGNPRYLLLSDLGSVINTDGADAWKNQNGSDFVAKANDIIEWSGTEWTVVLEAATIDQVVYVTNLRTGVQYKYEDGEWTRAFEGEYQKGSWRIVL